MAEGFSMEPSQPTAVFQSSIGVAEATARTTAHKLSARIDGTIMGKETFWRLSTDTSLFIYAMDGRPKELTIPIIILCVALFILMTVKILYRSSLDTRICQRLKDVKLCPVCSSF